MDNKKAAKYPKHLQEIMTVAFALDDLPSDPAAWTPEQARTAHDLILRLGAPESFLRRFARSDLA